MIKIWVDDIRAVPEGWIGVKTNDECLRLIFKYKDTEEILVSLDHDSGIEDDKDYIAILAQLDYYSRGEGINFDMVSFHFHTDNPIGRQNMRTIVQRNGWREVYSIR
jgi:hypothetical protein